MKVSRTGRPCHGRRILQTQPSTNCDLDSPCCLFNELRQRFTSTNDIALTARCQHPLASNSDNLFQGVFKRSRVIERTIEGHLKRPSHLNQPASTLNIDSTVFAQHAKHHSARTKFPQMLQVVPHDIELRIGINKVSPARTQQYMHRQPTTTYGLANQAMARGQPTFTQRAAQLNTVCTALSRNQARVDTLGT